MKNFQFCIFSYVIFTCVDMCNDLKMFRLVGVSLENFFLLQWLCLPGSTTKDSGGGVPIEN